MFCFTESDMWRHWITKLTFVPLRQCISLHMSFPFLETLTFGSHVLSTRLLLFWQTPPCRWHHHCITLEVHFNTYSESIEHLTTGLFRIYLVVGDGSIWNCDSELFSTKALKLEAWTANSLSFIPINQLNYSPWSVLENIRLAFITLTTRRYGDRKSTTGKELDISDVSIANHFYLG